MEYSIRKARLEDTEAVSRICFLTLDSNDERFREIAGLRWAIPYLRYEIDHCFVAVDENDAPIGYILSSPNAKDFRKKFRKRMSVEISKAFRKQRKNFSPGLFFIREYLESSWYVDTLPRRIEKAYPAHLHIDILPEYQGRGIGIMLLGRLKKHLKEYGCPGIHLGVGKENTGAIRFYEKAGFNLLKKQLFGVYYYGIKL